LVKNIVHKLNYRYAAILINIEFGKEIKLLLIWFRCRNWWC